MKQINKFTYEVAKSPTPELIRLVFTAVKVGDEFVGLAIDGVPLKPHPGPTFSFPVSKEIGETHFGMMEATFLPGTPDDACFTVEISGSHGGVFDGPELDKSRPSSDIEFRVVEGTRS